MLSIMYFILRNISSLLDVIDLVSLISLNKDEKGDITMSVAGNIKPVFAKRHSKVFLCTNNILTVVYFG